MSIMKSCTVFSILAVGGLTSMMSFAEITITDSQGIKTFEQVPERVVALNWDLMEQALELDVALVGGANIEGYNTWVAKPHAPETTEDTGTRAEPNLEKIAALKPDVILAAVAQKDLLPRLEKIAPVAFFENYSKDGNPAEIAIQQFEELAVLFNKQALAEQKISGLYQTLSSLKQQLNEAYNGQLPSVVPGRFGSETTVYLYTENSTSDWVLGQLGLTNAMPLPPALWGTTQKRLTDLKHLEDAYFLYIQPFLEEEKLNRSFIWKAMPFVRAKHYNSVEPVWSFGGAMSLKYMAEAYTNSLIEIAP